LVPALIDVNNPGLTGGVQNQPDFQAGAADHRTHFANAVPALVRQAMEEYAALTRRCYQPVHTFRCEDADSVMIGLGSVTDDIEAVVGYLRRQGQKVGLVAVKLLQPFPEAELVAALRGKQQITVLERSDQTELTMRGTRALFKARENADRPRHPGIPAIDTMPKLTTAIFGLGGHDLQPRRADPCARTNAPRPLTVSPGQHNGTLILNGLFDPEYYEEMVARPFREGTIGEAPVLPGSGLFMPSGTAVTKDKGLFRRFVPEFHADVCSGCMECALACPDAAIPNTVHDIHELLLAWCR